MTSQLLASSHSQRVAPSLRRQRRIFPGAARTHLPGSRPRVFAGLSRRRMRKIDGPACNVPTGAHEYVKEPFHWLTRAISPT